LQPQEQVSFRRSIHGLRRSPSRVPGGSLVMMMALAVVLSLPGSVRAQADQHWSDIPLRKWSRDEIKSYSRGPQILDQELNRQREYQQRWHQVHDLVGPQHVSRKSQELLRARRLGQTLPQDDQTGGDRRDVAKALEPDVLRVLLVRVAFASNRDSQLTTVSGNGDFMLEPLVDPGPLEIDPPPHNRAYFQAHMEGLSEYYRFQSGGRLLIETTVLPEGENDSYKLSDVADYGPGAGSFWSLESLETLVQDMITTCDQGVLDDGLGFSLADYDDQTPFTYVVFVHAGSDWQSDINQDSPNDIPTFFVNLGEPVALQGVNPAGQPGLLSECSVVPETTNQDGAVGSIAAALYHEFGHALGLPDVYNTSTGLPSVGIWDLMDSGTNLSVTLGAITDEGDTLIANATGLLPPSLSVWCKWYLGWLEMGEISDPLSLTGNYPLPAVGVPRDQYARYNAGYGDFNLAYPQAYRAGSSPREYFLLENRWVPDNSSQTPFFDLRFERDEATGVVQYLAGQLGANGPWENSGLYDFFLPAGGLLVWHVNADRIENELPTNTVNAYGDGLRLVEGDGIQDVGVLNAFVQGWLGSWRDPFGGFDANGNPTGFSELYPDQFPSSRNYDRSLSGVHLSEIAPQVSRTASVMQFRASLDPVLSGFPWEIEAIGLQENFLFGGVSGSRGVDPITLTPLVLGAEQLLIFADAVESVEGGSDYSAALYGVTPNGEPRWDRAVNRPAGAFQSVDGRLAGSPLVMEHATDGAELIWTTRTGTVGATHLPGDQQPTVLWTSAAADSLISGPLALRGQDGTTRYLVAAHPDSLYLFDRDGIRLGSGLRLGLDGGSAVDELQPTVLPFSTAAGDMAAVFTGQGWFVVGHEAAGLTAEPDYVTYGRTPTNPRVWSAVTPTTSGEVLVRAFDGAGELGHWAVAADGTVATRPPLSELDGSLVCAPAVADVDGDGRHDLVLATATRLYGFKDDGIALRGFPVRFTDLYPLADSTRVQGPLVVADGTGDGVNEIFFNTTGGHLVGLSATGRLLGNLPLRWADRAPAGLAVGGQGTERVLWLVSSGGYTNGFLDRIPVNGRVSAYRLTTTATPDGRTSEWLGPGGGVGRTGATGAARALGAVAPVSAEMDQVYLYPNPLSGDDVTIRFFSEGSRDARLAVYNLEGEIVASWQAAVTAQAVNEIVMSLPDVASGLYLARLEFEGTGGREIRTLTLAVER